MPSLSVVIHPPFPESENDGNRREIDSRAGMFGGIWKFLFGNESYFLSVEMLEIRWSSGPGRDVQIEKIKWRNARSDKMRNGEFGALLR